MSKLQNILEDDVAVVRVAGALLALILICTIWSNRFLPMQDYPQHLFMAEVANTYDDPSRDWTENFELRNPIGPYRALFLAQRALSFFTDVLTSGRILATIYVLLIALLAYQVTRQGGDEFPAWGALLYFPFCLHPMYFFGFFSFTCAIPVLLFTLLDLKKLIADKPNGKSISRHVVLQVCLFMLHPYALLVYIVLSLASIVLLARDRRQRWLVSFSSGLALLLFIGWSVYNSMLSATGEGTSLSDLQLRWWPVEWNLSFLAMTFTGMRFTSDPNWIIAAVWGALLLLALVEFWRQRREYTAGLWFPELFCMALAGFFVLPFSVQMGDRYAFFNARMAPISFFLLVPVIAAIPMGRLAGRAVICLCLLLTCNGAYLHNGISNEVESSVAIFDKMEPNAAVLPLIGGSRSAYLDPFFYNNFHYHFPFYYHILKGGGINPYMFNHRLYPVGYREGKKPDCPTPRERYKWASYRSQYDYILVRQMPDPVRQQLMLYCEYVDSQGPWSLFKVK